MWKSNNCQIRRLRMRNLLFVALEALTRQLHKIQVVLRIDCEVKKGLGSDEAMGLHNER
ncbi:uncharacterized protein PHALS_14728 [Plasmopara halstedii]|uniref:Uncharacterized protein n=1 Tax=Plasmopara halstedii TaxID=4781 RepID=A0A0P1A3S9_PLAHL|nr:uncharacterized protein PHALS_14728 [Plasmopara halstedii]CEG35124.1 hypothetical protein PHALS_14728 [Plasmopara halstedii]|eukprot:XP_024571493.1 hypothetical protein PHALS_14728 [Plasmopara halstedii]